MADNPNVVTTTTIGSTIVIKGKLKSDEDLVVHGRIDAEITSSKALLIENSGVVKANLKVKSAKISGVVVGNVTADSCVEIAADGRVIGDINAPRIIISDGAAFRGKIDMQGADERETSRSTPAPSKQAAGPHAPAAAPLAAAGGTPAGEKPSH